MKYSFTKYLKALKRPESIIIAFILLGLVAIISSTAFLNNLINSLHPNPAIAAGSFYESFNGNPSSPLRFWNDSPQATNWDVVANQSDTGATGANENGDFSNPHAHHGTDCSAPLDANNKLVTHPISNIHDAVFICKDHLMTSLLAGYALVYLTPNQLLDLNQGETTVRFDMTTFSSSGRDWVDMWITPFQDNYVLPLERWNAPYNGEPKNAVHIRTDGNNDGSPHWEGEIYRNHNEEGFNGGGVNDFYGGFKSAIERSGAKDNGLPAQVSPKRRDTFELRISKTGAKMCLVSVNVEPPVPTNQCFFDAKFSDLGANYSNALIQFGHHAYNPQKDCTPSGLNGNYMQVGCLANTWHWDEFKISQSKQFTIIKPVPGSPKFITKDMSLTLNSATPANSYLRFAAVAGNVEVSFNNGASWTTIPRRDQVRNSPEHFSNYWGAIPQGVKTIKFRGTNAADWLPRFVVEHVAVYSTDQSVVAPSAAPSPSPSVNPSISPSPSISPRPSAPPSVAPSPSTAPGVSTTVTFNDKTGQDIALSGKYPDNLIDWGSNKWYLSGPWEKLTTKSISFNSSSSKSASFNFLVAKTLTNIDIYNGGGASSTITFSCSGNANKSVTVISKQLITSFATNWSTPCTSVTISSTNGWDSNFDNLIIK